MAVGQAPPVTDLNRPSSVLPPGQRMCTVRPRQVTLAVEQAVLANGPGEAVVSLVAWYVAVHLPQ